MRRALVGTLAAGLLATTAFLGAAAGHTVNLYHLYDCTGAGSLDEFWAWKTLLPAAEGGTASSAAAFHLTDGSAVFVVLSFGEGNFSPPGIDVSGNATVTCSVDFTGGTAHLSGFLAPPRP